MNTEDCYFNVTFHRYLFKTYLLLQTLHVYKIYLHRMRYMIYECMGIVIGNIYWSPHY